VAPAVELPSVPVEVLAATLEQKLRVLAQHKGGSIRVLNENNEKLVIQFTALQQRFSTVRSDPSRTLR
jgi:hypothetical protein